MDLVLLGGSDRRQRPVRGDGRLLAGAPAGALCGGEISGSLIAATVLGNALLNGLLAQALGTSLSHRQSLLAILMSFVIAVLILVALAPVTAFLAWAAPAATSAHADQAYSVVLLSHVGAIAYAGVAANVRLYLAAARAQRQRGHRPAGCRWRRC